MDNMDKEINGQIDMDSRQRQIQMKQMKQIQWIEWIEWIRVDEKGIDGIDNSRIDRYGQIEIDGGRERQIERDRSNIIDRINSIDTLSTQFFRRKTRREEREA